MKIAIVGSGIGGIAAARELHAQGHLVTVYEQSEHIGGHAQTLRLPADKTHSPLPNDLGTVMFNPTFYPQLSAAAKELNVETEPFPLTFTYETKGLHWTTELKWPKAFRYLEVFLSQFGKRGFFQKEKFLIELFSLLCKIGKVHRNGGFSDTSLSQFIEMEKIPKSVVELWLLPQLQCWWGVGKKEALSCSTQLIFNCIHQTKISEPFFFKNGISDFIEAMARPFIHHILLNSPVERVSRKADGVEVLSKGKSIHYDRVIFDTPPNIALKLLSHPTEKESKILSSFSTGETEIFVHTDPSWMPKSEKKALANLIHDERGSFSTFWSGALHPSKPNLYITWGDSLNEIPQSIIFSKKWVRTLPTVASVKASRDINELQGCGGVGYCGAHVQALPKNSPSLSAENALLSGRYVANCLLKF